MREFTLFVANGVCYSCKGIALNLAAIDDKFICEGCLRRKLGRPSEPDEIADMVKRAAELSPGWYESLGDLGSAIRDRRRLLEILADVKCALMTNPFGPGMVTQSSEIQDFLHRVRSL